MTDEQPVYIRDSDANILNAARDVLDGIAKRSLTNHDTQASGMVFALSHQAENALFAVMNYARSHGGQHIADDVIYNRGPERDPETAAV